MEDPAAARIETLQGKLREDPDSKLFLQLSEEYRRAGKLEDALEVCRKGVEKNPCYHSARASLGRLYMELGREEEAAREFERVLSAAPENLLARRMLESLPISSLVNGKRQKDLETETLAEIYLQQGHRGEAIRIYERIVKAHPDNGKARAKLEELRRAVGVTAPAPKRETSPSPIGPGESDPVRRKITALRGWLERIHRE